MPMNEEIIEVTVRIRGVGPRAAECIDLIASEIADMTHLTGRGDDLSGARVIEVRR